MAAIKSTKKAKSSSSKKKAVAKKVTAKKTTAKKAKKTKKAKSVKKSSMKKVGVAKKKVSKTKTKSKVKKISAKKSKKTVSKSVVGDFLADVVKNAHKTHKAAQAQTKIWIKNLNSQDKQLSQLHKKQVTAKGKSRSALESKISKLQDDMSGTRTCLLNCENDADKIVTFIEWTTQLHSKPAIATYLQAQTTSRPTLVKKSNFTGQEEYPQEIEEDDDMNFVFGDDDEDMDESSR